MNDAIGRAARAAARRLAGPEHPFLADDVEEALAAGGATGAPGRYADPVALGGLVVSAATLAWTVYNDIRSRGAATPDIEAIARRVRRELDQDGTPAPRLDPAQRDRIVGVTVEETLNAAEDREPDPGHP